MDAERLEKDIEAIPGICGDAKKAIKKLFENNFDVKFNVNNLELGNVVLKQNNQVVVLTSVFSDSRCKNLFYLTPGKPILHLEDASGEDSWLPMLGNGWKKIADSTEDYFRKKFNGELK